MIIQGDDIIQCPFFCAKMYPKTCFRSNLCKIINSMKSVSPDHSLLFLSGCIWASRSTGLKRKKGTRLSARIRDARRSGSDPGPQGAPLVRQSPRQGWNTRFTRAARPSGKLIFLGD